MVLLPGKSAKALIQHSRCPGELWERGRLERGTVGRGRSRERPPALAAGDWEKEAGGPSKAPGCIAPRRARLSKRGFGWYGQVLALRSGSL